ncbi:helix-turn-helix domain-containing protein [Phytoactinopolyspora halotolerans]|uniref:Helix-turn-helix domain-containing protein n=1 Tax=Phytoactinopolyspora halotolerans TaxID=1981512 RepID=A0A6L9SF27_9ACTN|nr:helix-turn-helix domain-containing protein [Phytoactinopolyspora halotolerans]NEE03062.1 helix-turn-helix domain-containing protein [Phytoactinopolyspora halotolerans]
MSANDTTNAEKIVDDERTLGDVIRNRRLRRGLEQRDVARMAGVTLQDVQALEQNESGPEPLFPVLSALEIPYLRGSRKRS